MKKTLVSMMGVAVVFSSAMAQENKEQQPKEFSAEQSYNVILEKQMQERAQAFNRDGIQKNDKELAKFLARQRERVMAWEREREKERTR